MTQEKTPAFQFYPKEWLTNQRVRSLSLADQGRLFTDIAEAVAAGDREAVKQWQGIIGRIYWREKVSRRYLSSAIKQAVLKRDGWRCVSCSSDARLEVDHIVPYSRGGDDTMENLQTLCKPCNCRKGASLR